MIVIIDNKDSFVWNLASYASQYDSTIVVPNDTEVEDIIKLSPDGIIISPGPGSPDKRRYVGNVPELLQMAKCPILGVCLGHQIIAHCFGGVVERVAPLHGKASEVIHDGNAIYKGIKNPLKAGRYHSLAVIKIPEGFHVTAFSKDGTIMGIRSNNMQFEGVQFHPESILTEFENGDGLKMIENFIGICGVSK